MEHLKNFYPFCPLTKLTFKVILNYHNDRTLYMEKHLRTYDLEGIKAAFQTVDDLRMTRTARKSTVKIGLRLEDVVCIIQSLTPQNFYKSMTTYADHRVWQDVYHARFNQIELYIKFMVDPEGHLIVSFKEKEG